MSPIALRELLGLGAGLGAGLALGWSTWGRHLVARLSALTASGIALPALAAAITILTTVHAWGSWPSPPPQVHDEAAYLFQARVFASGRWTAPAPAFPEFFEQAHVLVTPARAAKYPPGHSLALVPGIIVGFPPLMPLALAGGTAWLVVLLARALAGGGVSLLTWMLWLSSDLGLRWRPTYFSQSTTMFCAVLTWFAVLNWMQTRRMKWLVVVALSIGWMAITRPVTAVALGAPVLAIIAWQSWRDRTLRGLVLPTVVGLLVLSLLPVWALKTTGDWREWPLGRYTAEYLPFDRLGLGLDSTPARRALPPGMEQLAKEFRELHASHTWAALPGATQLHADAIARAAWNSWRRWLAPAFLAGLFLLPGPGLLGIGSVLALIGIMMTYAHPVIWTLYYTELTPIFAFFTSMGVLHLLVYGAMRRGTRTVADGETRRLALALLLIPLIGVSLRVDTRRAQATRMHAAAPIMALQAAITTIPDARAIVFLRHPVDQHGHAVLIDNAADLDTARAWLVHDLGEHNRRLLQRFPDRGAYVWDVSARTLRPFSETPGP